jgi:phosphoglycolate phosphatase-like HAD superfamily hydrolase
VSHLAIFDVDRTLVQTTWSAGHGFVGAVQEVLGIGEFSTDWFSYRYSSDNGITDELCRTHLDRSPTDAEIAELQARYMRFLDGAIAADPGCVSQVTGAAALMAAIAAAAGRHAALATGGWRVAATRKLETAGVDPAPLPGGFADDAWGRSAIIATAQARAEAHYGTTFDTVCYVGDARWDVAAARRLGIPFLGVGTGERAASLRLAGARTIIPDYRDTEAALQAIATAEHPHPEDGTGRAPEAD